MAAAVSNRLAIDPAKNGKHSITISEQFRYQKERPKREFINVQCKSGPVSILLKSNRVLRSQSQANALFRSKDGNYTVKSCHRK